jgi:ribosomal protein L11 methyltransferase
MSEPHSQSTDEPLLEVSVEVAGIDTELVADVMRQVCSGGVAIEHGFRFDERSDSYVVDGAAPAIVRGYIPAGARAQQAARSLRLALRAAPLQHRPRWRRNRTIAPTSWRDSWKKHFGILRAGNGLVIAPSWVRYSPRQGETVIRIDPAMAFGTGQHPTTAMCLRALKEHVRPEMRVLDLGCGSGILAIAAAKLRASQVVALDIDPQAVKATRANAAANEVASAVHVREGTLDELGTGYGRFDLILANISALTLERLAPALSNALVVGGTLASSGFLDDAVPALTDSYRRAGLSIERVIEDGVWRAIIARKHTQGKMR